MHDNLETLVSSPSTTSKYSPRGPYDHLADAQLLAVLSAWCAAQCPHPIQQQETEIYYHTVSPRSWFFKSCADGASVLDMGAGNGALSVYKEWPPLVRPDIDLYGVSLEPIDRAATYKAVSISNFETNPRPFPLVHFDAVIAAHFIEHLADPTSFVRWVVSQLKPGGGMYLEWPHPFARRMPGREFFIDRGLPVFTTQFMDDDTHVEPWPAETILDLALASGLHVETWGRIILPRLANQLRDIARRDQDMVAGTFAVWAAVGWAQYVVLFKPADQAGGADAVVQPRLDERRSGQ